jgi:hypothetical protein
VTRDLPEPAAIIAGQRGAHLPERYELNLNMLLELGVPRAALVVPDRVHDNTAAEAVRYEKSRKSWVGRRWSSCRPRITCAGSP